MKEASGDAVIASIEYGRKFNVIVDVVRSCDQLVGELKYNPHELNECLRTTMG